VKVEIEDHGVAVIVKAIGKIDIGDGDVKIRNTILKLTEQGARTVILDMKRVRYMDSSGIGELMNVWSQLQNQGVKFFLTNVNSKVYDLMSLTRLITVFNIYDSNEDVLQIVGAQAA
jgi:anti-sigma B factor antagonist